MRCAVCKEELQEETRIVNSYTGDKKSTGYLYCADCRLVYKARSLKKELPYQARGLNRRIKS